MWFVVKRLVMNVDVSACCRVTCWPLIVNVHMCFYSCTDTEGGIEEKIKRIIISWHPTVSLSHCRHFSQLYEVSVTFMLVCLCLLFGCTDMQCYFKCTIWCKTLIKARVQNTLYNKDFVPPSFPRPHPHPRCVQLSHHLSPQHNHSLPRPNKHAQHPQIVLLKRHCSAARYLEQVETKRLQPH